MPITPRLLVARGEWSPTDSGHPTEPGPDQQPGRDGMLRNVVQCGDRPRAGRAGVEAGPAYASFPFRDDINRHPR